MRGRTHPDDYTTWNRPKPEPAPCTECRKRRLQCQRPFPCDYCVKHGLGDACLQSSIVKGTRSLKPSAIAMHEDLAKLSIREQELEQAIADIQSTLSNDIHPLLVKDPQIRTASPVPGLQRSTEPIIGDSRLAETDELIALGEAFNSLQIGSQYHGDTASSEHLISESGVVDSPEIIGDLPATRKPAPAELDLQVAFLSTLFPIHDEPLPKDVTIFLHYLPPYNRALKLINNYHTKFSWCTLLEPVPYTRAHTFDFFYPDGQRIERIEVSDSQNLAYLFMMLLLGTLYDTELDIDTVARNMEIYHTLARAALASYPVYDHPRPQGIRAIVLIIWYFRLYPGRQPREYQWALSGVLSKCVEAGGYHREIRSRYLSPQESQALHQTFWEFYCNDIWHSFMFGRPTSLIWSKIDCKRPIVVDVPSHQHPDFFPWKYAFTELICNIGSEKAATYEDTLLLEKKLRSHPLPASIAWPTPDQPLPEEPVGKLFQRYIAAVWQNAPLFYIHRRWVPAMLKTYKTADPMSSPHWGSAVTAYKSARALVGDMLRLWHALPALIERMAPFWSHTGSAAIALGALVACVPHCDFADDALLHLEQACEMFDSSRDGLQPPGMHTTMRRLLMKARYALDRHRSRERSQSVKDDDIEMTVSPSEIFYPYTFGDSTTPSDAAEPSVAPPAEDPIGKLLVSPRDAHLVLPPQQLRHGRTGAYDAGVHPPSAWEAVVSNNLFQMQGRFPLPSDAV